MEKGPVMSEILNCSGKRYELSNDSRQDSGLKVVQRPGGYTLLQSVQPSGSVIQKRVAYLQKNTGKQKKIGFQLNGHLFQGHLEQRRSGQALDEGSEQDLIAQFSGKMKKHFVAIGQDVKKGEPLVAMEAMKMEFQIKAPYDLTVVQLPYAEGAQITAGTFLIETQKKILEKGE